MGIEFEDSQNVGGDVSSSYLSRRIIGEPEEPMIIQKLKKMGFAKNSKKTVAVLAVISVVIISLSGYLIFKTIQKANNPVIKNNLSSDVFEKLPLEIQERIKRNQ